MDDDDLSTSEQGKKESYEKEPLENRIHVGVSRTLADIGNRNGNGKNRSGRCPFGQHINPGKNPGGDRFRAAAAHFP
jgi:hypothetical protein